MAYVLAYVDDLMFTSRIREAAGGGGPVLRFARDPQTLRAHVEAEPPALLIADVDSARLDASRVVEDLLPRLTGTERIGFFSHVHADRAQEARRAGFTRILPRSAFVKELPAILKAAGPGSR